MLREILENSSNFKKFEDMLIDLLNDILEVIADEKNMNKNSMLNVLSKPFTKKTMNFLEEIDFNSYAEDFIDSKIVNKFVRTFGDNLETLIDDYLEKYADEKGYVEPLCNILKDKIEYYL